MELEELATASRICLEKCLEAIYDQSHGDGETALHCIECTLNGLRIRNNEEISRQLGLTELV